jgi:hypothetical protein
MHCDARIQPLLQAQRTFREALPLAGAAHDPELSSHCAGPLPIDCGPDWSDQKIADRIQILGAAPWRMISFGECAQG